jgi:hypothetical protein
MDELSKGEFNCTGCLYGVGNLAVKENLSHHFTCEDPFDCMLLQFKSSSRDWAVQTVSESFFYLQWNLNSQSL